MLSVVLPILNEYSLITVTKTIYDILNLFYFFVIIGYYFLDIYTETFLYPATARKHRKGFSDNSLRSKFLNKKVEGYYTKAIDAGGAGAQGIMYGYACNNSYNYLPQGYWLVNSIAHRLDLLREETHYFLPDEKFKQL